MRLCVTIVTLSTIHTAMRSPVDMISLNNNDHVRKTQKMVTTDEVEAYMSSVIDKEAAHTPKI